MFQVANRIGQLLEIRVVSPFSINDAGEMFKQIYKTMPRGQLARVICDLRGLRIVDPAVVDLVSGMMQKDNPSVERNAFLMPESGALLVLQSDRLLKQIGASNRRSFRQREDLEAWMAELLTPGEQRRLNRFLDEHVD